MSERLGGAVGKIRVCEEEEVGLSMRATHFQLRHGRAGGCGEDSEMAVLRIVFGFSLFAGPDHNVLGIAQRENTILVMRGFTIHSCLPMVGDRALVPVGKTLLNSSVMVPVPVVLEVVSC
jgi:hypothetical protein